MQANHAICATTFDMQVEAEEDQKKQITEQVGEREIERESASDLEK